MEKRLVVHSYRGQIVQVRDFWTVTMTGVHLVDTMGRSCVYFIAFNALPKMCINC